ncbi:hypothetical protein [Mesorhizobium sp. B2-8-5]|uniref:hypothetical protein n=1 Tax=Mesorhizobium sp. B2-8-5 TaxID=2589903 RepID=UPI001D019B99|nr:hypothetical protein [Mesorhizobium sp. B2-8-5]UCI23669.1 hypothetical protein FJ430_18820 [Mesorhizobium sp. B2-8-5]
MHIPNNRDKAARGFPVPGILAKLYVVVVMTKLSELPEMGRPGKREGGEPKHQAEHFYTCRFCHQVVDKRDLRQVLWHEQPVHDWLEFD